MSSIIELQYIFNISSQLERFRAIEPSRVYNFRCNVCGDSDTHAHKARGYFFHAVSDDIFMFACHNCGTSYSFQYYLKLFFNSEYKDLRTQIFKERGIRQFAPKVVKEFKVEDIFDKEYQEKLTEILKETEKEKLLTRVINLNKNHPARLYLKSRKLSLCSGLGKLYYTDNYEEFIRSVIPSSVLGERKIPNDSRIVFPLKTIDNEIVGFQGRCIGASSELRYSILMMAESYPKMFGLERIKKDSDDTIFVTEGAMDSLFLPNAIALNGGDANALNDIIVGEKLDKNRFIIILDNEPRSKDTINRTEKAIKDGYKVLIWDGISPDFKDINDMILNNIFTPDSLLTYILNNSHKGAIATLKLKQWSKF